MVVLGTLIIQMCVIWRQTILCMQDDLLAELEQLKNEDIGDDLSEDLLPSVPSEEPQPSRLSKGEHVITVLHSSAMSYNGNCQSQWETHNLPPPRDVILPEYFHQSCRQTEFYSGLPNWACSSHVFLVQHFGIHSHCLFAVTDSVLCASEDCVILQSIRNTSIAPT